MLTLPAPLAGARPARYRSTANRVTVRSATEGAFLRATLARYSRDWTAAATRRTTRWRTPPVVRQEYDAQRARQLERLSSMSWDDAILGPAGLRDFVLVDDRVEWGPVRPPLEMHLARLAAHVRLVARPGDTVVEFCSGNGRNLLHLARLLPGVRFVGLELSPTSVELARRLARRFGVPVEFHERDVAGDTGLRTAVVAVAFSYHGLEQMPRIADRALAEMCRVASRRVVLMEPLPELWPLDARGLVSRLRVRALDRLRGLDDAIHGSTAAFGWRLASAVRLGTAVNPLNETCEVVLEAGSRLS